MGQIYKGDQLIMESGGGGGSITVDSALSTTSTNPVQNKVITEKVNELEEGLITHSATAPATPIDGMLWYDETDEVLKIYSETDTEWKDVGVEQITYSATAPTTPTDGQLRYDETNKVLKIYGEDDAEWKELGEGGVTSINGNTGDITMSTGKITLTQNGEEAGHFFLDQTIDKTIELKGLDKSWKNKTVSNGELELGIRTICYPSADFTLTMPAELVDGEEYVVRFINGSTPYNMTLGHGFTNPFGVDLTLSADAKDQFTFMAIEGILELQPAPVLVAPVENPQAPTGLEATVSGTTGTIKWTDPLDAGTNIWLNTKLVRKAGSEPTSLSDGTVVVTVTTRNQYQSTGYDDTGLTAGTTYYYRAFAEFDEGEILGSAAVNITPTLIEAGIYHSATLGLITIADGNGNDVTIADKNLGATTVYNDGDTLSEANCGKFYQRGNNYGFPFTGATTISATPVDASTYGPGNYYSSSTFITANASPYDWSSVQNDNLWGGTTGTNEAMQGPCATGFHVPSENELTLLLSDMGSLGLSVDHWKTYLKMPFAGGLSGQTGAKHDSSSGLSLYYSASANSTNAMSLSFMINGASVDIRQAVRSGGCSIRPFKNEVVAPDNTWTKLYPAGNLVGVVNNYNVSFTWASATPPAGEAFVSDMLIMKQDSAPSDPDDYEAGYEFYTENEHLTTSYDTGPVGPGRTYYLAVVTEFSDGSREMSNVVTIENPTPVPTLKSYSEICAMSRADAITEMNKAAEDYLDKWTAEGHMTGTQIFDYTFPEGQIITQGDIFILWQAY